MQRPLRFGLLIALLRFGLLIALFGLEALSCTQPPIGSLISPGQVTVSRPPYDVKAKPTLFETSFFPNVRVDQDSIVFELHRGFLGNLPITSGKVVAADPVSLAPGAPPFTTQFPRGRFPVELAIARFNGDERIAFARILFSGEPVASWELALLPGQEPLPLFGKEYYGYPVDGGMAVFVDAAGTVPLNRFLADRASAENFFITSSQFADASPNRGFLYAFHSDTLAAFSTGFGDGSYATYVGLDAQHRPCRLLADFQVIPW
ncbi:DUF4241 domain-containing protein [Hymenobacter weizhouensis]|uniref:DUF4241 domain-containing protein n=1 Tax=Hymenobacter sp. YIM 151500-1 TaxID=2987689 RepID=UPI0022267263|nr:DUF4241 domain-containing protein [Hymenobacter sp. YIM 151500-1]UYZ62464.1 DUF4241 domain-containing protein [Hymenobacter sp. YIM 151500-1]